ncbi:transglycosylase domain-containing protein [Solimonas sp. K1W22B-7]|uniref:transglycosylase domain-containing protein n=1 Tax=Solimonas sp. K1W22B-7 TaxID=2303331 RepID=UPI0019695E7D|nr:transglycosylase domain-containing protein [Solimonas sp. K1W22B-7]
MNRIALWLLATMVFLLTALFVAGKGWIFERHRPEILNLVETAEPADRHLPEPTRELLLFSSRSTASYAARLAVMQFHPEAARLGTTNWQLTWATWSLLIYLHLSEDERLALIARLAPTGKGRLGLSATSRELFGRPLDSLSEEEAAMLVVLVKAPSFSDRPEALARMRDRLIAKWREQKATKR